MSYCKAASTIAGYFKPSLLRHQPTPQARIAARTPKRPVGRPQKRQKLQDLGEHRSARGHYHREARWCWAGNIPTESWKQCSRRSN